MRAIAANEGRYPISAQCRLLGVARSTYYSMRSRADRPDAPDPAAPAVVGRLKRAVARRRALERQSEACAFRELSRRAGQDDPRLTYCALLIWLVGISPILIILIAGICGYFFGKRGGNGK